VPPLALMPMGGVTFTGLEGVRTARTVDGSTTWPCAGAVWVKTARAKEPINAIP